jgi:hypothetical protein
LGNGDDETVVKQDNDKMISVLALLTCSTSQLAPHTLIVCTREGSAAVELPNVTGIFLIGSGRPYDDRTLFSGALVPR